MSRWLEEQQFQVGSAAFRRRARSDRVLRAWDALSAAALAALLLWPQLLARCAGRRLAAWPVVMDVLAGRRSWVGPSAPDRLPASAACCALRPGVVTLWGLRQRTAVDFASETECDHEYLARRGVRHDLGLLLRALLLWPLRPSRGQAPEGRVVIGDVAFDNLDMAQALQRLGTLLDGTGCAQVSFVNPACVNIAARERGYRRTLARAALVLPDGIGIKIGADILGTPLKQNVNGTDLFPRLCELLHTRQGRLFLLGGQPGVPETVAERIAARWPGVRVVGCQHGFFSAAEEGTVVQRVQASGADVVLVARGVPTQDIFIDRYLPQFGARVVMGVGGLFDFVAGRINRAPAWMRDSGLEWVYRLMQEPGRMWRRYLLGNFSFLARVGLQRLGLRAPAQDTLPDGPGTAPRTAGRVQAVLLACKGAAPSLPVDADSPAALWPLGCASFLERALEHLAESGIRQVHLVVSHRPEALRQAVGDGQRWGLQVQWHLAQDADRPYATLRHVDWQGVEQVLVGHAEIWVGRLAVRQLAEQAGAAWIDDVDAAHWSGWASAPPAALLDWPVHAGFEDLARHLQGLDQPRVVCAAGQTAVAGQASDLLAAQSAVQEPDTGPALARAYPGAWIRMPWGAMSPSARVHPGARFTGPVLLGPGCLVDDGVHLGPDVVLERDVVVARRSHVAEAVVLANTFIGQGLTVSRALVNGNRMHPLDLGVTVQMPASDGLLAPLRPVREASRVSVPARALALLALAVLQLPSVLDAARRRALGRASRWQVLPVVSGQDPQVDEVLVQPMRVTGPQQGPCGPASWLDAVGPLCDVVRGHRAWLGRRPMEMAQWCSLSDEWRALLGTVPVGVFHAAAWQPESGADGSASSHVSEAALAADLYLAANTEPAARRRCLWAALPWARAAAHAEPAASATAAPPPVWHAKADPRPPAATPPVPPDAPHDRRVLSTLP